MKTWNRERKRTRDRLLDYDFTFLWENPTEIVTTLPMPVLLPEALLEKSLYNLAVQHGFSGTLDNFWDTFSNSDIYTGTLHTFPVPGNVHKLYLDTETDILYYFKSTTDTINTSVAERMGIFVIYNDNSQETYLYIPIRAMPAEDLIYDCGDAT